VQSELIIGLKLVSRWKGVRGRVDIPHSETTMKLLFINKKHYTCIYI